MPRIETANKGYFLKISEFRIIKKIGLGSFGQVSLAIHKPTKRKYAIKIIGTIYIKKISLMTSPNSKPS